MLLFVFPAEHFKKGKNAEGRDRRFGIADGLFIFFSDIIGQNQKAQGAAYRIVLRKYDIPDAVGFAEGIGQQLFDCCTFGQDDFFLFDQTLGF